MSRIDRLAERLDDLEAQVNSRAPQAAHTTIVNGAIDQVETYDTGMVDAMGLPVYGTRLVSRTGRQPDGGNTMVVLDGPTPPSPAGWSVTSGPGTLTVKWDGSFAGGVPTPTDFYAVTVHMCRTSQLGTTVLPSPVTLVGSVVAKDGDGITVGGLLNEEYTITVVTVSQAGKWSAPATPTVATPGDGSSLSAVTQMQSQVAQAVQSAQDAQAAADGKVTTYLQPLAPDAQALQLNVGDLWFDTDDGNKLYRWSGSAWVLAQDQSAAQALTTAQQANTTANNAAAAVATKIQSYYQTAQPAVNSSNSGDLWIDTDDGNRLYRFNGSIWVDVRDATITSAKQTADNALALANGKGKVYSQGTAPNASSTPPPVTGDLWYDTTVYALKQYNGSTWNPVPMDASQNIRANTITSSLLATQIVLASTIVAGPLNNSHAEISQDGISLYQSTSDGVVRTSRLGATSGDDFIQVYSRTNGQVVAALDQLGGITARKARLGNAAGDTMINGQPFETYFEGLGDGLVAWGQRTTNGSQAYGTETKFMEVQVVLQSKRLYRVTFNSTYVASTTANNSAVLTMRQATGGAAVGTLSTQLQSTRTYCNIANQAYTCAPMTCIINTAANSGPLEYRFLVGYLSDGVGSGNVWIVASTALPSILTVEDMGPSMNHIGIDFAQTPPPSGTKQNYTTYWAASASATYQGNGTKRTDVGQELVHGNDPSGYNGNGCGIALFMNGAYSSTNTSENGKTLSAALTGATITACSVMLHPHHAYYNSGATIFYVFSTYTTIPSSLANPGSNYYGYASFAINESKYVTGPTNTIYTSIIVGQAPSTDLSYYARLDGAGYSYAPVMRVSYTR